MIILRCGVSNCYFWFY